MALGASRVWTLPALAGLGLGVVAFVPDRLPEWAGRLLVPLVSSGFAWGLAALVVGYLAHGRRSAITGAACVLAVATVVYYGLTLVTSRLWDLSAADTVDGSSGAEVALWSVAPGLVLWLAASSLAGPLLGWLGQEIRHGSGRQGPIATGIAFGLLAGQGAYVFAQAAFVWIWPLDTFLWGKMFQAVVQVVLSTLAVAATLWLRRQDFARPLYLAATASVAVNVVIWHFLHEVQAG